MTVLESTNPDWYHADYEGYSGMVPRNYFEEFYAPAAQAAASEPERGRAMSLDGDANGYAPTRLTCLSPGWAGGIFSQRRVGRFLCVRTPGKHRQRRQWRWRCGRKCETQGHDCKVAVQLRCKERLLIFTPLAMN